MAVATQERSGSKVGRMTRLRGQTEMRVKEKEQVT